MKHISYDLQDSKAHKRAIAQSQKKKYKSVLVQIYTGCTQKKKLRDLLERVTTDFPQATLIGTTTAGEISHAKMYENSTIISLSLFENTSLKSHYVKTTDADSALKLSQAITSKDTKANIILSEGLKSGDYEGFIKNLKKENPKVIIAGGLAGDNFQLKKTFIFLNGKIYTKGSVAVSFSSENLYAANDYNLNWTPIGKEFEITSVTDNLVHTIDNIKAVEFFKRYLGSEIFENNALTLPDIQLLYKEGNTTVSRTPLAVDGNSLVMAGPLKEGQRVQFGFSNASSVISGSDAISKDIASNPAQSIYIFSCIARKTLLGRVLENEFKSFENIAPTAGFFTYGEFFSADTTHTLLNCTTTILVLSEKKTKHKKNETVSDSANHNNLDNVTFNALSHFVESTSNELKENVKLLNEYKDVVDNFALVSKTDLHGIITYVNDNFCQVSQYKKEELLGQPHNIVRHKDMSSDTFKILWQTILAGSIWRGVISNRAKDGSVYHVDATIMPIYNEHNEISEFIAIRQNITKQVQAKRKMQENEKLIKAIFENQDSIVVYTSKNSGMISVNKKLFEYFEYIDYKHFREQHQCICDLFIDEEGYIHPEKDSDWLETLSDNEEKDYKAKMLTKNGIVHTFTVKVKRINENYIVNLNDITNLENALLKAYQSEQAKGTFLANMSHEIRTPLNGILGFTEILADSQLDSSSKKYVEIINKSGETLLSVVNDILDYSKLESGEFSLYETEADLFKDMEATVSTFASLAKSKHIDYYVYIDTDMPKLLTCDSQRLKQVINNLISNAIKFTPENGQVDVKMQIISQRNKSAKIKFSVEDSGIGIAKDKIDTIFKAFSQADNSTSREFGGTGLGLSISSQYIQMMHSQLKVKSKEGIGSQFSFVLNLPIVNKEHSINSSKNNSQLNIFVFDSTDRGLCGINKIIYKYLKSWNFHYTSIDSLEDVREDTDVLIMCSKLFDQEGCKETLNAHKKLQLLFIEGSEDRFTCEHEQFHLIEQPMTGSALFDKLIVFASSHSSTQIDKRVNKTTFEGNILVAEDNETNQVLISVMLEERGLKYTIVNNGQEAIDAVADNDVYNIILMDINMPVLDGVAATRLLRKAGYKKPIVSLSANVIESDIISFKEAGVDDSLHKPINTIALDAILSKYTKREGKEKDTKLEFDAVSILTLSEALMIENRVIILKLLNSFVSSAQDIIAKLKEKNLDKDLAHLLKGLTGNLRFHNLYTLFIEYEESIENWNKEEHERNKAIVIEHLENLCSEVALLNE